MCHHTLSIPSVSRVGLQTPSSFLKSSGGCSTSVLLLWDWMILLDCLYKFFFSSSSDKPWMYCSDILSWIFSRI